ncbi:hypothetical protein [Streptomyces iconiensis]|uniref:Secreted protein n=1 Tax=Streptomyces iconiensis TaxID=1384038 RepID=A0ABT6ZNZ5_9ACTN|nr:hypothetical protein [Streptomyces iconiensis]MDJ1130755.1 hypothetical protein [Streptomyces iconiensis]
MTTKNQDRRHTFLAAAAAALLAGGLTFGGVTSAAGQPSVAPGARTPVQAGLVAGPGLTAAEAALAKKCRKMGYGRAIGVVTCPGSFGAFKVRVWCTWAGKGLSNSFKKYRNSARCSTGHVHEKREPAPIEIIKRH